MTLNCHRPWRENESLKVANVSNLRNNFFSRNMEANWCKEKKPAFGCLRLSWNRRLQDYMHNVIIQCTWINKWECIGYISGFYSFCVLIILCVLRIKLISKQFSNGIFSKEALSCMNVCWWLRNMLFKTIIVWIRIDGHQTIRLGECT